MRADAAAAILAGLAPDQAYSISVVLAGRNANVPTE
jgi:flagellar motility protein MotE (MotC chaperone)